MVKPIPIEMMDYIDFDLKKLLCHDLKGLRFIRFWGTASNSKYRKGREAKSKSKEMIGINGMI